VRKASELLLPGGVLYIKVYSESQIDFKAWGIDNDAEMLEDFPLFGTTFRWNGEREIFPNAYMRFYKAGGISELLRSAGLQEIQEQKGDHREDFTDENGKTVRRISEFFEGIGKRM
jgi:hypothetical protein